MGIALARIPRLLFSKKKISIAHGSSRWAEESDLLKASIISGRGVILGQRMKSKKLLSHDEPEHIIAIAPTRGGQGVGLVVPTLLRWPKSTVIFDPKGENWQITSGYRSSIGECLYFDPTSNSGASFNPLAEIRKGDLEIKDARLQLKGLVESRGNPGEL